jgi:hypothetical protein
MRESFDSIDNRIEFRETFNSEQNTRRLGGVPTDVVYENGKIQGGTITSSVTYKSDLIYVEEYSIRIKTNIGNNSSDFINSNGENKARVFVNSNGLGFWLESGFKGYYNGDKLVRNEDTEIIITVNSIASNYYINGELVFTGAGDSNPKQLGNWRVGYFINPTTTTFDFVGDLMEVYIKGLTAEEIKNLYENKTYKELPDKIDEQLGDDLVTNGGFDTDTDWVKIGESEINNGTGRIYSTDGSNSALSQTLIHTIGKKYRITIDVVEHNGNVSVQDGLVTIGSLTGVGVFTFDYYAQGTSLIFRRVAITDTRIDNIVVKELIEGTGIQKILDVNALNGVIKDNMGNTLTLTDVEIKKVGPIAWSPEFNATTSKIDCGNFDDLTGDITYIGWFNNNNNGSSFQRIIENGKLIIFLNTANRISISSDGAGTIAVSSIDAYKFNKNTFIAITRTSTGIINIYVGDIINAPILNGSANQDSGTPSAGTTNIILGSKSTGVNIFNGTKPIDELYKGILSLQQITQEWSNNRRYF